MKVPKEAKKRAKQLREAITKYRTLQHVEDVSPISPEALDSLKYELAALEEQYPELVTPDSPTQVVAGAAVPYLKKVRHAVPQWSFNDAFTESDIRAFDERVRKVSGGVQTYDLELKIDGLKIILTYEKGVLVTVRNARRRYHWRRCHAQHPHDCISAEEITATARYCRRRRSVSHALGTGEAECPSTSSGRTTFRKSAQCRCRFHPPT